MRPGLTPNILLVAVLLAPALLAGCATSPFSDQVMQRANRTITPTQVSRGPDRRGGLEVLWGGVIAASRNLADSTELTVVAYPLDYAARPDLEAPSTGRFVLRRPGYLEPADFAPGRTLTAFGPVTGLQTGQVGERSYVYPVVEARQLHLWPAFYSQPQVYFGVGVGIISH
jgi:outer membrane lipoprotein